MIRMELAIRLEYQVLDPNGGDFVFNIQAARTSAQRVLEEKLVFSPAAAHEEWVDANGSRLMRVHAGTGSLTVSYDASVQIDHHRADPASLREVPVRELPQEVLPYLSASRYCQSDRLANFAYTTFGALEPGYGRVLAVRDWVQSHVRFASNTSNSATSAIDTFVERVGVCRDFAHLMIALCRALNLPARIATGTDFGSDPALGPPDFHAYVEVYLSGRWYMFDASGTSIPMGFLRFGTGTDAGQVAFATIFGGVRTFSPFVSTRATDAGKGLVLPHHCADALSTADVPALPAAAPPPRPRRRAPTLLQVP